MGLACDPDAILLYWPSRLDPVQRGIELLEDIAQAFVNVHPEVHIAVLGDPKLVVIGLMPTYFH